MVRNKKGKKEKCDNCEKYFRQSTLIGSPKQYCGRCRKFGKIEYNYSKQ